MDNNKKNILVKLEINFNEERIHSNFHIITLLLTSWPGTSLLTLDFIAGLFQSKRNYIAGLYNKHVVP